QMLELSNARALAREQEIVDAEARALDQLLDEPDPLGAIGSESTVGELGIGGVPAPGAQSTDADTVAAPGGGEVEVRTLQMIATSADVDVMQRSP
ncbi:Na+/H+ antiporter, partial [Pseudomonas sp. BGM005]|nr:Na+/H+ antiporter [Pseudomonas sp. BG5]